MIKLVKINGAPVVVNAEILEIVESTPDTIITLTTGKKLIVKETIDEIIQKVVDYKKAVLDRVTVVERTTRAER